MSDDRGDGRSGHSYKSIRVMMTRGRREMRLWWRVKGEVGHSSNALSRLASSYERQRERTQRRRRSSLLLSSGGGGGGGTDNDLLHKTGCIAYPSWYKGRNWSSYWFSRSNREPPKKPNGSANWYSIKYLFRKSLGKKESVDLKM